MRFAKRALAAIFSLAVMHAHAAGLRLVEVPAEANAPALKAAIWSPCASAAGDIKLGPFVLAGVRNCPIAGDHLPMIVISHGFGGTYLGHHDTAEALADAGFIVVALNHPDDTASNPEKGHNLTALISRPADIKRLIDFMLTASPDAAKIDPQRIGFFGFSRGGYTGLVLAGANPDFRELSPQGQGFSWQRLLAWVSPGSKPTLPVAPLTHDTRIKAYFIADPLSSVFATKESVQAVTAPLELWGSEHGGDGVLPENLATVARNLPVKPEYHVVPKAAHFAFLSPCPAALSQSAPEICVDGPGFDRAAFHVELNTKIVAFFKTHL